MKSSQLATLRVFALSIAMMASPIAHADEAADRRALQSLVKQYEAAIQQADPSVLKPHLAPEFTGVMVTGEEVKSYESLEAYWNKIQSLLGEDGRYSVKINIAEPAKIVGDVAYANGTTEDTAITGAGEEYEFEGFWTAICTRQDDGWKIVRIHGSMDALTNAFIAPMLKTSAMTGGVIGGVVGFVIGAVLLWILGRRHRPAAA